MSGWQSAPLAPGGQRPAWMDAPEALVDRMTGITQPAGVDPLTGISNAPVAGEQHPPGDLGAGAAAASGFVRGLPVVGPTVHDWITELAAHLDAGPGVSADYLKGAMEARNALTEHEHPTAEKLGEAGGGVAGYGAVGAAAPVLMGGGSLPLAARAAISGLSGGALGAADTAARGGDTRDILINGGIGTGLGLAAPVAGAVIGAGMRPAARAMMKPFASVPGMRGSAASTLAEALLADDAVRGVPGRLRELGPEGMLVDAGPTLRGWGQGIASAPGRPRSMILNELNTREAGATDRILNDMDTAFGPAQNPLQATRDIQAARGVEHQALPGIFASAPPVDIRVPLGTIGQKLNTAVGPEKAALERVWQYLTEPVHGGGVTAVNDAEKLSNAKTAIDNMITFGEPGLGIPAGALQQEQGALKIVRKQLSQALRDQVPGYGNVMDRSAALAKQGTQIEAGTGVLDSGKGAVRPDELQLQLMTMSPSEQDALRLGTRADIDRIIRQNPNDRIALRKALGGEGDWNREKLGALYGQPAADTALNTADREATFFDTRHRIVDNSETAPRLAAAKMANPDAAAGGQSGALAAVLGGPEAALGYAAVRAGQKAIRGLRGALLAGRNADLARALVQRDPQALTQALLSRNAKLQAANRFSDEQIGGLVRALTGYEGAVRHGEDLAPAAGAALPLLGIAGQALHVLPQ